MQSLRIHPLLSHGDDMKDAYDITNFKNVHSEYGTIENFEQLVEEVHSNGERSVFS